MIDNFIIDCKKNINDALNLIDKNARGIVFVVKNKKLVGVLTDGDIRRFFLKGFVFYITSLRTKSSFI